MSERSELGQEVREWVEAKGISTTCPLCGREEAWDLDHPVVISPFTSITVGKITAAHSGGQGRIPKAGPERILTKMRQAISSNLRGLRLVKLSCKNCAYSLLLDHKKIRGEEEG